MKEKRFLIVVDMQNDFIDGALGTPEAEAIVGNVKAKIASYPEEDVFFTRDTHQADYMESQWSGSARPGRRGRR